MIMEPEQASITSHDVGVVAIGRNEGDRLRKCLESVLEHVESVVYVDSGSTDGSVAMARTLGAEVVELDPSLPFTAARARNEGFERLVSRAPHLRYVQFVDGDCEFAEGWLDIAREALESHPDVAIVCGRRRERYPEASLFNRLADIEWNTPIGPTRSCGGDAMMRSLPFREIGGYDSTLIAGEEPDLCLRLRRQGWGVMRLDAEMTLHDMAMTRFGQWWKRAVRSGHAYAEGAARHGRGPEKHWVRPSLSIWVWGAIVPLLAVGGAWPTRGMSLLLLLYYPVAAYRASRSDRTRGLPLRHAALYGMFCVVAKFPQVVGQWKYFSGRMLGRRRGLIEYKGAATDLAPNPVTSGRPR